MRLLARQKMPLGTTTSSSLPRGTILPGFTMRPREKKSARPSPTETLPSYRGFWDLVRPSTRIPRASPPPLMKDVQGSGVSQKATSFSSFPDNTRSPSPPLTTAPTGAGSSRRATTAYRRHLERLDRRIHPQTPPPRSEPLNYAEFSPDSQSVVTTSNEGLARIWDSQTGKEMGVPLKHDGFVRTARFSSDNLRIVTCSFDNTARIWDARTGLPLSGPCAMTVTSSGQPSAPMENRIATSGTDTLAYVWDFPPGLAAGSRLGSRFGRSGCRIAHR